jgi:hypothetical protein
LKRKLSHHQKGSIVLQALCILFYFKNFVHFGRQLELDDVPKDASPRACEHEQVNMST